MVLIRADGFDLHGYCIFKAALRCRRVRRMYYGLYSVLCGIWLWIWIGAKKASPKILG